MELDWNQGANNSFGSKQTEASTCRDSLLELGKEGIGFLECAGLGGGYEDGREWTWDQTKRGPEGEARAVWRDLLEGGLAG